MERIKFPCASDESVTMNMGNISLYSVAYTVYEFNMIKKHAKFKNWKDIFKLKKIFILSKFSFTKEMLRGHTYTCSQPTSAVA